MPREVGREGIKDWFSIHHKNTHTHTGRAVRMRIGELQRHVQRAEKFRSRCVWLHVAPGWFLPVGYQVGRLSEMWNRFIIPILHLFMCSPCVRLGGRPPLGWVFFVLLLHTASSASSANDRQPKPDRTSNRCVGEEGGGGGGWGMHQVQSRAWRLNEAAAAAVASAADHHNSRLLRHLRGSPFSVLTGQGSAWFCVLYFFVFFCCRHSVDSSWCARMDGFWGSYFLCSFSFYFFFCCCKLSVER